ncbi:MAG: YigZ family protein [Bacteroidota bacterium]
MAQPKWEVVLTEKKSKFLGFAYPLADPSEVGPILKSLKHRFPKANHICYAWQTGIDTYDFKVHDDGEPKNSAGMPILGQIQSFALTHVLVCVVRFFGGVKLGIGGLVSAYRSTARMTLEGANIVEKPVKMVLELYFDYGNLGRVMRLTKHWNLEIIAQKMEMRCALFLDVPKKDLDNIMELCQGIPGLTAVVR